MITTLCLLITTLWALYRIYIWRYSYFARKGFFYLKPTFPYGYGKDIALFTKFQGYTIDEIYKKLEGQPYGGYFVLRQPRLLIRDLDIVRHILIKDFSHFRDRNEFREDPGYILSHNLFSLGGERWRALRAKMTPTFSSGKLKTMFPLFQSCSEKLIDFLARKVNSNAIIDIKDEMANFTTDIICTCAFGLEIGALDSSENQFREIGKRIFPSGLPLVAKLKLWLNNLIPTLKYIHRSRFFEKKIEDFIVSVVTETVEYREKNSIVRNDFLNLLIQLKNKGFIESQEKSEEKLGASAIEITMDLLIAQCFVFFAAGFETSSSVTSFCFFELAKNKEIQDKLRQEIDQVSAQHGGITYQALQEMTYLAQVIDETLRKYPTVAILERVCVSNYTMPDSGLIVEKGTEVKIPVYSIHHDPTYYPDPEKFDPDRFLPERKALRPPCSFMPFGEGPRLCIGMRFGLLQSKMGIASVLSKYQLLLTKETQDPLNFICTFVATNTKGPIYLQIRNRD